VHTLGKISFVTVKRWGKDDDSYTCNTDAKELLVPILIMEDKKIFFFHPLYGLVVS
jgi:hypothetical protein